MRKKTFKVIGSLFLAFALTFTSAIPSIQTFAAEARETTDGAQTELGESSPAPSLPAEDAGVTTAPSALGQSEPARIQPFAALPDTMFHISEVALMIGGVAVSPNTEIPARSTITLNYTWDVADDVVININDYYEFAITQDFDPGQGISDIDITDSLGEVIGKLSLGSDRTVRIQFTNADFLTKVGRHGEFAFDLHFSAAVQEGPGRDDIALGFSDEQNVWFENPFSSGQIDKKGDVPNDIANRNVNWTVDMNHPYTEMTNTKLVDTLPEGLSLVDVDADVAIYELQVNLNGIRTQGAALVKGTDYTSSYNATTRELTINYLTKINSPKRILIHSTADEAIYDASFLNNAVMSGMGMKNDVAVEILKETDSTVNYHRDKLDPINKIGYYFEVNSTSSGNPFILWRVRLNYDKSAPTGQPLVLTDLLSGVINGGNQTGSWEYDSTTVTVWEVTPTGATSETKLVELTANSDYTLTFSDPYNTGFDQAFTMTIGDGTNSDKAYFIEYETPVDAFANLTETGPIYNKVTTNGEEVTKEIIVYPPNLYAGFNKTVSLFPENHKAHWTIDVNNGPFNLLLHDVQVADYFNKADGIFDIDYTSFRVYRVRTNETIDPTNYTLAPLDGTTTPAINPATQEGFSLVFAPNYRVEGHIKIEFDTEYDFESATNPNGKYTNNVAIDYGGKRPDADAEQEFPNNISVLIERAGKKSGRYNKYRKEFTWEIFMNYNNAVLDNAVLTDLLGANEDHEFVPGSIKIFELKYTGDTALVDRTKPVRSGFTISESPQGFTLTFANQINKTYGITYNSKPVGVVNSTGKYTNTATQSAMKNGAVFNSELVASVSIPEHEKFVKKSGNYLKSEGKIDWTVTVNPNQSTIQDAILTDRLSKKQVYGWDSFKLYHAAFNSSQTLVKGSLVDPSNYNLVMERPTETEGEGFTLSFLDALATIDKPFILEYQQIVINPGDGSDDVINSASLAGMGLGANTAGQSIHADFIGGYGHAVGWVPTTEVQVGGIVWREKDGEKPDGIRDEAVDIGIPDVTIFLTDANGNPVKDIYGVTVAPVKTGTDGTYLFEHLIPLGKLPAGSKYVTHVDYASSPALAGIHPTIPGQGDISHGSETDLDETTFPQNGGEEYLHLDYGFTKEEVPEPPKGKVRVGGIVWREKDGEKPDGIRDEAVDLGIEHVTIFLTDQAGNPVKDIFGNIVAHVKTGADGTYLFENLTPLSELPAGSKYVTHVDYASSPALAGIHPTIPGQGDISHGSETDLDETTFPQNDGQEYLHLDFGFTKEEVPEPTKGKVNVGGIVWREKDGEKPDGIRDEAVDLGIGNVTIYLTDQDGNPVKDIFGNIVAPTRTNAMGKYLFENLIPLGELPAGSKYVTHVDYGTSPALSELIPTLAGKGDISHGSETDRDETTFPQNDGEKYLHLDFGFSKKDTSEPEIPEKPSPPDTSDSEKDFTIPDKSSVPPTSKAPNSSDAPLELIPPHSDYNAATETDPTLVDSENPNTGGWSAFFKDSKGQDVGNRPFVLLLACAVLVLLSGLFVLSFRIFRKKR